MTYIAESTAMMVKSLIYRNETPFMKRQAQQCAGLTERMSLVVKTQCKFHSKTANLNFHLAKYWTCLQRSADMETIASEV